MCGFRWSVRCGLLRGRSPAQRVALPPDKLRTTSPFLCRTLRANVRTASPPAAPSVSRTQRNMLKPARIIHLNKGELLNEGRYRIDRELNRGGTAVVYSAEDMLSGNQVALKVMNGPDQVPIKVVRREITFSSSMQHDNIVRLLDVFCADKQQMVIVWELIKGPDLLDLLNENGGCLPESMAAFYFVQLLEAVTFMHAQGFCHRDIKPENCMVQRSNNQLKLIDFGLSKHLNSAYTLGVGTPDYMCPEMLPRAPVPGGLSGGVGPPTYDARAVDAWAMGVMMFLLTTGKYPFEDPRFPNNLAHTISNVLAGRVRPFPPTMSAGCSSLISGLLRVDPKARTTLAELKASRWLNDQARLYACAVGSPHLVDFSRYQSSLPVQEDSRSAVDSGVAAADTPADAGAELKGAFAVGSQRIHNQRQQLGAGLVANGRVAGTGGELPAFGSKPFGRAHVVPASQGNDNRSAPGSAMTHHRPDAVVALVPSTTRSVGGGGSCDFMAAGNVGALYRTQSGLGSGALWGRMCSYLKRKLG